MIRSASLLKEREELRWEEALATRAQQAQRVWPPSAVELVSLSASVGPVPAGRVAVGCAAMIAFCASFVWGGISLKLSIDCSRIRSRACAPAQPLLYGTGSNAQAINRSACSRYALTPPKRRGKREKKRLSTACSEDPIKHRKLCVCVCGSVFLMYAFCAL